MSSYFERTFALLGETPATISAILGTSSPIMNSSAVPVTLSSDGTWDLFSSSEQPETERKLLHLFSNFSDTLQFTEKLRLQNDQDKDFVKGILENLINTKRYFTRTIRLLRLPSADDLVEACSSPQPSSITTPVVFSNLRSLTIKDSRAVRTMQHDDHLKTICTHCPFLESMSIPCQQTDAGVDFLSTLKHLKTLDLTNCKGITDSGLQHLERLSSLQSLNLECCRSIADSGLEHFAKLASLQSLNLQYCGKITDSGLQHLAKLPSLQSLNLTFCWQITDSGLEHLAKLPSLMTLNLQYCTSITDSGLRHLAKLPSLKSLNLSACTKITDRGLQHLAKLSSLQSLNLRSCDKITNAGLHHLANLSNLQALNLGYCYEINDSGLQHLAKLPSLQSLDLSKPTFNRIWTGIL